MSPSRILSPEELEVLVQAATVPTDQPSAAVTGTYNFRRPDRISKEQLRSLHFLHDRFAVNVSTSLSVFLRAMTEVTITSVDQFAYGEFLSELPDPTAFYAIGMAPLDGMGALEIHPVVAFSMVDRMLGGAGDTKPPNRALTEIEQNVLDSVVKLLLEHLTETWRAIVDVEFRIQGRETRPQMLQVTGPNEIVVLLMFEIRLGSIRGALRICIPAAAIESTEEKVAQMWHRTRREPTAAEEANLHANIGRIPLPVTTLLETRMATRDLLALRPGDLISLGRPASGCVDVRVGQIRRFTGRLTAGATGAAVRIERVSSGEALQPGEPQ